LNSSSLSIYYSTGYFFLRKVGRNLDGLAIYFSTTGLGDCIDFLNNALLIDERTFYFFGWFTFSSCTDTDLDFTTSDSPTV
jgi:hypothetical protein